MTRGREGVKNHRKNDDVIFARPLIPNFKIPYNHTWDFLTIPHAPLVVYNWIVHTIKQLHQL